MTSLISAMIISVMIIIIISSQIRPVVQAAKPKLKNADNLKPSIFFEELQLRHLCEEEDWIAQFLPIRSKWTKCLGFKKIFLPTERPRLKKSTFRLLEKFLDI